MLSLPGGIPKLRFPAFTLPSASPPPPSTPADGPPCSRSSRTLPPRAQPPAFSNSAASVTETSLPMASDNRSSDGFGFLAMKPYSPPSWASHLRPIPSHLLSLGHVPTPIHRWNLPDLPDGTEVWLKRDDLSGMQLSGNKVRKLEFLLADAVSQGADCVITIGGIQSNHCRATAVAAKYLNLDCYLILRTSKALVDNDPGLMGNLLVERLVGAHVDLISKEEYAQIGSVALTELLKEKLQKEGRKPYVIPVGGSNSLGTWGYVEAIREIEKQVQIGETKFDDVVVACGSGGTIAGLSLGSWLSSLKAKVHAFSVCDDPDYFHDFVQDLLDGLEAGVHSRDIVTIQNAKGLGYAMSTAEELLFIKEVATATGVILDPVYSGKAAYAMMKDMKESPNKWKGRRVLFVHTGGLLGLFDKVDQMAPTVGKWRRMDVHESFPRKDGVEGFLVLDSRGLFNEDGGYLGGRRGRLQRAPSLGHLCCYVHRPLPKFKMLEKSIPKEAARGGSKPRDKQNIVTGANVQDCWEKFLGYFEVKLKKVKLSEDYYMMDPVKAVETVDENTIRVTAILGSTLRGEFEDVKLLNELLEKKNEETGWDTPIHVDAASGGFHCPVLVPPIWWVLALIQHFDSFG
ncbi:hypothetical protein MLD38_028270 [Melastoma candidum]|uniref:Uncharacterized protein n=1 Tax=Melastoma candidum TaxID=119954 RepID=A0ACB9N0L3_9MYRT|nr:hypothetical protein MLD38_028270 [Melastoma candidum]